jgi:hypothetical protein
MTGKKEIGQEDQKKFNSVSFLIFNTNRRIFLLSSIKMQALYPLGRKRKPVGKTQKLPALIVTILRPQKKNILLD